MLLQPWNSGLLMRHTLNMTAFGQQAFWSSVYRGENAGESQKEHLPRPVAIMPECQRRPPPTTFTSTLPYGKDFAIFSLSTPFCKHSVRSSHPRFSAHAMPLLATLLA